MGTVRLTPTPVAYLTAPLRAARVRSDATVKMAAVGKSPRQKLILSQNPPYLEELQTGGVFAAPPEGPTYASIAELFRRGLMPTIYPPFGAVNSDAVVKLAFANGESVYESSLLLASSSNEAPLARGQFTFKRSDGAKIWGREQLSGRLSPGGSGIYYCLTSGNDGISWEKIYFSAPGVNPFTQPGSPWENIQTAISGKPLVWEGAAVPLARILPTVLSDLRHLFLLPEITGLPPIGSRQIEDLVREEGPQSVVDRMEREEPLIINLPEEINFLNSLQFALAQGEKAKSPPAVDVQKIMVAMVEAGFRGRAYQFFADKLTFPLILNAYRHAFWAETGSGSLLTGIISGRGGATLTELQQFLLKMGTTYALAFGAGKDCRFYFGSRFNPQEQLSPIATREERKLFRVADDDLRPHTIATLLLMEE